MMMSNKIPGVSPITIGGQHYDEVSFVIGLVLAISSSVFIGSSFIIKKVALRRLSATGNVRASAGGFSYLKQWLWWLGFITKIGEIQSCVTRAMTLRKNTKIKNSPRAVSHFSIDMFILNGKDSTVTLVIVVVGVGEAANLIAYAFAPAALVTPLGALSVLVAAILASRFLKEKLNFIGKIGCFLCIIGSTVIVIHSPKEEEIKSFVDLTEKLQDPLFISYMVTILVVSASIKVYFGPRYGSSNVSIYLMLCSAVGSLTVVFCKAVALAIKETILGKVNNFSDWLFWTLLVAAVLCIMVQMNYLNKSLDTFNTSIVTPVYYVMFTVLVIVASGLLFREWMSMEAPDILGCACGFLVVITAIFMLNAFKDMKISFKDLNMNSRRRRDFDEISHHGIYGSTHVARS